MEDLFYSPVKDIVAKNCEPALVCHTQASLLYSQMKLCILKSSILFCNILVDVRVQYAANLMDERTSAHVQNLNPGYARMIIFSTN